MDDVAFYPADPDLATTLTADQVCAFNDNGFISPLDALTDEETELDAGPDEDETRIVPVSDSIDSDEDEDTTAKPVDPSLN